MAAQVAKELKTVTYATLLWRNAEKKKDHFGGIMPDSDTQSGILGLKVIYFKTTSGQKSHNLVQL